MSSDSRSDVIDSIISNILNITREYEGIHDYEYMLSSSASFREQYESNEKLILSIISDICSILSKDGISIPDDVLSDSFYEDLVDIVDRNLELVDFKLDEMKGNAAFFSTSTNTNNNSGSNFSSPLKSNIQHDNDNDDIIKPQLAFLSEIDNSRERPFVPVITTKHHTDKPLNLIEISIHDDNDNDNDNDDYNNDGEIDDFHNTKIGPKSFYQHPYQDELKELFSHLPQSLLNDPTTTRPVMPPSEQPFVFIETEKQLAKAIKEIEICSEIAVDLEHNSIRSFQGLTCLMQLSTRTRDYIIDTLALRTSIGKLAHIFANPNVVKVFHGCDKDVLWLQRDFGIYVVNCFDTYQASTLLSFSTLSLKFLLQKYCKINVNKKHQTSDWRIRPLPDDMIAYAKDDTHYLLYIYDCLRRDVWRAQGTTGLHTVFDKSRHVCLGRYEKKPFYPIGYKRLLKGEVLREEQDLVMRTLWEWRDEWARKDDESVGYIMSNDEMLRIAKRAPRTVEALEACELVSKKVIEQRFVIINLLKRHLGGLGGDKIEIDTNDRTNLSHNNVGIMKVNVIDVMRDTLLLPYQLREYNTVLSFKPLVDTTNIKTSASAKTNKYISESNNNTISTINKQQPLMSSLTTLAIDNEGRSKLTLAMQEIKKLVTYSSLKKSTVVETIKATDNSSSTSSNIDVNNVIMDVNDNTDMTNIIDTPNVITNTPNILPNVEVVEELPQSIADKYQLSTKKNKVTDKKRKVANDDADNNDNNTTFDYPTIDIGAITSSSNNNSNSFNKNKKNKNDNSKDFNPYLFDNKKKKDKVMTNKDIEKRDPNKSHTFS